MAQDSLTYEERRARAPKRIRLTRDEAMWQGIELAIQIKTGETGKAQSLQSLLPDALLGLRYRRLHLQARPLGGALCALVSVWCLLAIFPLAWQKLAFAFAVGLEHRSSRAI